LVKLKPQQEYVIPVIALRNRYMQGFLHNVRFGFIFNERKSKPFNKNTPLTNEVIISELQTLREKQENVIWSDPVTLTATNFQQYEIRDVINDSTYSIRNYR
jgi:rRNA-processing protein FCF1